MKVGSLSVNIRKGIHKEARASAAGVRIGVEAAIAAGEAAIAAGKAAIELLVADIVGGSKKACSFVAVSFGGRPEHPGGRQTGDQRWTRMPVCAGHHREQDLHY